MHVCSSVSHGQFFKHKPSASIILLMIHLLEILFACSPEFLCSDRSEKIFGSDIWGFCDLLSPLIWVDNNFHHSMCLLRVNIPFIFFSKDLWYYLTAVPKLCWLMYLDFAGKLYVSQELISDHLMFCILSTVIFWGQSK